METTPNVAQNVKDVSSLVNLLKEDEMNEDSFLELYNGMADDAHKLTIRRGELITEIGGSGSRPTDWR